MVTAYRIHWVLTVLRTPRTAEGVFQNPTREPSWRCPSPPGGWTWLSPTSYPTLLSLPVLQNTDCLSLPWGNQAPSSHSTSACVSPSDVGLHPRPLNSYPADLSFAVTSLGTSAAPSPTSSSYMYTGLSYIAFTLAAILLSGFLFNWHLFHLTVNSMRAGRGFLYHSLFSSLTQSLARMRAYAKY